MKFFKKISSWFKSHPELSGEQPESTQINAIPEIYPKALEKLRCSTSCTGIDCKHHYDPERMSEYIITLADGTNLLVTGKEFIAGPPYYVEGEPILAEDIWEKEGSNAMHVDGIHEGSTKASRYVVDDLPDSAEEGEPIWVEGKDPYLNGGIPDEVVVQVGFKYSPLSDGVIDDPDDSKKVVRVNKIKEWAESRTTKKPDFLSIIPESSQDSNLPGSAGNPLREDISGPPLGSAANPFKEDSLGNPITESETLYIDESFDDLDVEEAVLFLLD